MSDPTIPTPQDAQLLLQDTVTKAAAFDSAAFDLGAGFAPGGLGTPVAAIVSVSAADFADGNETYSFVLQDSADGVTFSSIGAAISASATGTLAVPGRVTHRYIRLRLTTGGTTPSITYKAWLNPLP